MAIYKSYANGGPVTPWGRADSCEDYGEGVKFYSTPSHGGFRISGAALRRIPQQFRMMYSAKGWFEEDCDWAIPVYFLPEYFSAAEYVSAVDTLSCWHPNVLKHNAATA